MIIKNLSEQEYRAHEGISASDLVAILACPAKWRYGERKETPAMAKGTQAHACLLEPEKFADSYYRIAEASDYAPSALETVEEIKAYLVGVGVKAPSAANKPELAKLAHDHGAIALDIAREQQQQENTEKTGISASDYAKIAAMSSTIYAQDDYCIALTGADVELSIVDVEYAGVKIKARLDIATKSGELWDYKTTTDASPGQFGKAAHNYNYWLKMAFYHDMYKVAFGKPPSRTVLLAQEKEPPYLCQAYKMTKEQLQEGRNSYQMAMAIYRNCLESGSWPAYGGGIMELETPGWIKVYS